MTNINVKELCKSLSQNDDEYFLLSSIYDKFIACENKNIVTNTKFLDVRQRYIAEQLIIKLGVTNYVFDGGNEDTERRICVFLPDYPIDIDILRFIRATKSSRDNLSHRDYLGSLMGLQIKREYLGDIFIHELGADIVVLDDIAEYIMMEYQKAGRKQLSLDYISREDVITGDDNVTVMKYTVTSMRLDLLVSTVFKLSRKDSDELIKKGRVLVNSIQCIKEDKVLDIDDKINIRGKGKAIISDILGTSKKGKNIIEVKKYG